jgi:hypothetical protein
MFLNFCSLTSPALCSSLLTDSLASFATTKERTHHCQLDIKYLIVVFSLSKCNQLTLPSQEVQVYLRSLQCGNNALLKIRFFEVATYTTLTALSLLTSFNLHLFQTVGVKIPSFPTFALQSPNKISIWYLRNWSNILSSSS